MPKSGVTAMSPELDLREALSRTLLLLRDHFPTTVSDNALGDALQSVRIAVVGDRSNLRNEGAQHALVTTALLAARAGATVHVAVPDMPLVGVHPPLEGPSLGTSLLGALDDLLPGVHGVHGLPRQALDLAVLIGDTRWSGRAERIVRLQGDDWAGEVTSGPGCRWLNAPSPFGALAAAGLAAGEAFKTAAARLSRHATHAKQFNTLFAPSAEATVRVAPPGTPPPIPTLGAMDAISGGAIVQSAIYALARIQGCKGVIRVFEPDGNELSNLNRYALLRRSKVGIAKAVDLASQQFGGLQVQPVVDRYDAALRAVTRHAPYVLVGVDDIPSRWEVQGAWPSWLGVGATSHYSMMVSYHVRGLGCARCLHPRDDPAPGPIPTVGFVSHWAGLWLAALVARDPIRARPSANEQSVYFTPLRSDLRSAISYGSVPRLDGCQLRCNRHDA